MPIEISFFHIFCQNLVFHLFCIVHKLSLDFLKAAFGILAKLLRHILHIFHFLEEDLNRALHCKLFKILIDDILNGANLLFYIFDLGRTSLFVQFILYVLDFLLGRGAFLTQKKFYLLNFLRKMATPVFLCARLNAHVLGLKIAAAIIFSGLGSLKEAILDELRLIFLGNFLGQRSKLLNLVFCCFIRQFD